MVRLLTDVLPEASGPLSVFLMLDTAVRIPLAAIFDFSMDIPGYPATTVFSIIWVEFVALFEVALTIAVGLVTCLMVDC